MWTTDVPVGGDGGGMFATNDDFGGNCSTNDQSAVLRLVSPLITMPGGGVPLLLIDHYVATEPAADGGNLKISVNGGPFELVPESAFQFNPYNQSLDGPERSHNPIAGQPAFSGLNETSFRGSWGQSQVNLGGFVGPGDSFRLRFDFGVDGCTGWDGWYLDLMDLQALELQLFGVRTNERKFLSFPTPHFWQFGYQYYDLEDDSAEKAVLPVWSSRLVSSWRQLKELRRQSDALRPKLGETVVVGGEMDDEVIERLKSLGYLGGD